MTDKEQIIIDGCNVLKCRHYQYKTLNDCEMRYPESGDCEIGLINYLFDGNLDMEKLCVDNPNCYFKQLARKTQKLERLERTNKTHVDIIDGLNNKYIDLEELYEQQKQECEELKEENEELNKRNNFLLRRLEVDDNDTSLVFKLQNELQQKSNEFYHAVVTNVKLSKEVDRYRKALEEIEEYCNNQNLKFDTTACEILNFINKAKDGNNE